VARNRKLGASSQDLSEIDDLDSYGEDGSGNRISGGGKGTSKLNFPISSDSNQSKSEEEKKNSSTFKNNSFSIDGANQPLQQALQPE
jgi:hypothetical protein